MPAGRPSKYKPEYCERAIECGKQGMSPVQIACALEVTRSTLYQWADNYPEFMTALTRAKELEQAHWERLGEQALFADKFQSVVWKKSMEARFRDDYTERHKSELTGKDGGPIETTTDKHDLARAVLDVLNKANVKEDTT